LLWGEPGRGNRGCFLGFESGLGFGWFLGLGAWVLACVLGSGCGLGSGGGVRVGHFFAAGEAGEDDVAGEGQGPVGEEAGGGGSAPGPVWNQERIQAQIESGRAELGGGAVPLGGGGGDGRSPGVVERAQDGQQAEPAEGSD
jgi:hypothetical protein